jgi:endoglycosylceramidase
VFIKTPLQQLAVAPAPGARRGQRPSTSADATTLGRGIIAGYMGSEKCDGAEYTDSRHPHKTEISVQCCFRVTGAFRAFLGLTILAAGTGAEGQATTQAAGNETPLLRTVGRHFIDRQGRVVILRGVNLSGDAKVPPFLPCSSTADLDRIAELGFNAVRMLFVWEAYEPVEGVYNDAYLAQLQQIAAAAWARGIYVIVDIHQDGFSRHTSRGAGDGFPRWAVSRRGTPAIPDNSARCRNWPILMAADRTTHRSFDDFYANVRGVRSRYLMMLARVSGAFARTPGVVGYDLLNEPWGDERLEIGPLYRDAGEIIRAQHPGALLFLEGHVTTNCGVATRLPRPASANVVYAPHYYRPLTIALNRWHGMTLGMNHAFRTMTATAQEWNAPLFLGEFGVAAEARGACDYSAAIYDRMDACLASGAQWCYSPRWNDRDKDGWNGEDFSILDSRGAVRPSFRPRPYPRHTAGQPIAFRYDDGRSSGGHASFVFSWEHRPEIGATEFFVPSSIFPSGASIEVSDPGLICSRDEARQVLLCQGARPSVVSVKMRTW